jgi:hypothetical protein
MLHTLRVRSLHTLARSAESSSYASPNTFNVNMLPSITSTRHRRHVAVAVHCQNAPRTLSWMETGFPRRLKQSVYSVVCTCCNVIGCAYHSALPETSKFLLLCNTACSERPTMPRQQSIMRRTITIILTCAAIVLSRAFAQQVAGEPVHE